MADAKIKIERSELLPKLYVEVGCQKIASRTGFYSYQIGLSMPLAFGAQTSRLKAARIKRDEAEANYREEMLKARSEASTLAYERNKWLHTVNYYKTEALPLVRQSREAAELAYREGAVDYLGFIQNMKECAQTELDYWDAWVKYLFAHFKLEYYHQPSNIKK